MLGFLPPVLRGVLALTLLVINTLFHAGFLFLFALLKAVVPVNGFRLFCGRILNTIVSLWIRCNHGIFLLCTRTQLHSSGFEQLSRDKSYLITSNHQSWADIVVAQILLNGRVPQLKFFLKQQLIWVPVLGLCWWALDFPFMKRYSREFLEKFPEKKGEDLRTTRKTCEKFQSIPVSIYNFMEGTRFTQAKHDHQKSPFRYLLKPRAGGTGFVLGAMGNQINTLLNITISYQGVIPSFWDFLCGRSPAIDVHLEQVTIPEQFLGKDYLTDEIFKAEMQTWVNNLWQEKDQRLSEMKTPVSKPV